jgi:hypothetical protein
MYHLGVAPSNGAGYANASAGDLLLSAAPNQRILLGQLGAAGSNAPLSVAPGGGATFSGPLQLSNAAGAVALTCSGVNLGVNLGRTPQLAVDVASGGAVGCSGGAAQWAASNATAHAWGFLGAGSMVNQMALSNGAGLSLACNLTVGGALAVSGATRLGGSLGTVPQLAAYYPLNGSLADASPSGASPLSLSGSSNWYAPRQGGYSGLAAAFSNTSNAYASNFAQTGAQLSNLVSGPPLTVAAWFYQAAPTTSNTPAWQPYLFALGGSNAAGASAYVSLGAPSNALVAGVQTAGSGSVVILQGPAVTAPAWHHVALTYDGAYCTAYLDGAAVGSNAAAGALRYPGRLRLADAGNTTGGTFTGLAGCLDEVRLYTAALSAGEVYALWAAAALGTPAATGLSLSPLGLLGLGTATPAYPLDVAGVSRSLMAVSADLNRIVATGLPQIVVRGTAGWWKLARFYAAGGGIATLTGTTCYIYPGEAFTLTVPITNGGLNAAVSGASLTTSGSPIFGFGTQSLFSTAIGADFVAVIDISGWCHLYFTSSAIPYYTVAISQVTLQSYITNTNNAVLPCTYYNMPYGTTAPATLAAADPSIAPGALVVSSVKAALATVVASLAGNTGLNNANPQFGLDILTSNAAASSGGVYGSVYIFNSNAGNSNAHANLYLRTNGSNSGCAFTSYDNLNVNGWSVGLDPQDAGKFKVAPNSTALRIAPASLTVTQGGLVGINSSNPAYRLDISGAAHAQSLLTGTYVAGNPDPACALVIYNGGGIPAGTQAAQGGIMVCSGNLFGLNLGSYNTQAAGWIQACYANNSGVTGALALQPTGGNVGINTSNPSYSLDVAGSARVTGSLTVQGVSYLQNLLVNQGGSTGMTALFNNGYFVDPNNSGYAFLKNDNSGNTTLTTGGANTNRTVQICSYGGPALTANTNGFGIGTATPAYGLHVVNNGTVTAAFDGSPYSDARVLIAKNSSNNVASMIFCLGTPSVSTGIAEVGIAGTNDLVFNTGPPNGLVHRMTIANSTGNVGIGSSNPIAMLDVNGTTRSSDSLYVGTPFYYNSGGFKTWMSIGGSNLAAGSSTAVFIGKAASTNNSVYMFYTHNADGSSSNNLAFQTLGTSAPILSMQVSGNVGIGTSTPACPLHVVGSTNMFGTAAYDNGYAYTFFGKNATSLTTTGGTNTTNVSILASADVAALNFDAYSDRRIKAQIAPAGDCLARARRLGVKSYTYVDKVAHGPGCHLGLIAQDAQQVLPGCVSCLRGFVPDVFALASVRPGGPEELVVTCDALLKPDVIDGLSVGQLVRCYAEGVAEPVDLELRGISADGRSWTLSRGSLQEVPDALFVYGRQVDDLLVLNYQEVGMLCLGGLQELEREKDELERGHADLERRHADLERRHGELERRHGELERRLAALEAAST